MSNQGRQLTYLQVYGPDTHITEIVPLALGVQSGQKSTLQPAKSISASTPPSPPAIDVDMNSAENSASVGEVKSSGERTQAGDNIVHFETKVPQSGRPWFRPFDANTRSFVYGLQPRAIQGMLDFDYSCGRQTPSVAAMIHPFGGHCIQKFLDTNLKEAPRLR